LLICYSAIRLLGRRCVSVSCSCPDTATNVDSCLLTDRTRAGHTFLSSAVLAGALGLLTTRTSYLHDREFVIRMLYRDSY